MDALVWIRRDIRLEDHVALAKATQAASRVAVVFVFDSVILEALEDRDDRRVTFLHESLKEVKAACAEHGSDLIVLHGNPVTLIPDLCQRLGVQALYFNGDVEPYAIARDSQVKEACKRLGVEAHPSKDHVIFAKRQVVTQGGEPFKVFTPYSRAWKARLQVTDLVEHEPDLGKLWPADELPTELRRLPSLEDLGFVPNTLWLEPGPAGAERRLAAFLPKLSRYAEARNDFGVEGTSGLSVHLRHGTLSVRRCLRAAYGWTDGQAGSLLPPNKGAETWINELIWREFYQMILSEFPHVVEGAFKPEWDAIEWPGEMDHLYAWQEGRTGFPIVDAAMRCFNATGWMHNRLRMVVAMFLTKDLLVDWRQGEAYFARKLLDFDLGANNGGWQWSASTGVDAQPYFRVFNPVLQSERYDPEGSFIAEWCPELRGFSPKLRHWPHDASRMEQEMAGCRLGEDYPAPIVDHKVQKERAVALFKAIKIR